MRSSNYTRTSYLMALFAERYTSEASSIEGRAFSGYGDDENRCKQQRIHHEAADVEEVNHVFHWGRPSGYGSL